MMPDSEDRDATNIAAGGIYRYLQNLIRECTYARKTAALQLKIDQDYIREPAAQDKEIRYCQLQVELARIEIDCLDRKLELLNAWAATGSKPERLDMDRK